jgi:manganese efflux pump family protein
VVSVALSMLGLEIGHRIGTRAGDRGEIIGGVVLIGVGIALAAGVI